MKRSSLIALLSDADVILCSQSLHSTVIRWKEMQIIIEFYNKISVRRVQIPSMQLKRFNINMKVVWKLCYSKWLTVFWWTGYQPTSEWKGFHWQAINWSYEIYIAALKCLVLFVRQSESTLSYQMCFLINNELAPLAIFIGVSLSSAIINHGRLHVKMSARNRKDLYLLTDC